MQNDTPVSKGVGASRAYMCEVGLGQVFIGNHMRRMPQDLMSNQA